MAPVLSRRAGLAGILALGCPAIMHHARAAPGDGAVRIVGNGAGVVALRSLVRAYAALLPGPALTILPSLGTTGGIAAVIAGAVDLSVAGRAITDQERAAGAADRVYAHSPLAFATHPDTPVTGMTLGEVERMFSGDLQRWPHGDAVRVVRRPHYDSDVTLMARLSPGMARAMAAVQRRQGLLTAATDAENHEALSTIRGSFGATVLAQNLAEPRPVRLLALDGVEPSVENLEAGRYPISKRLYFVLPTGRPLHPGARGFLEFVEGPEGQALLRRGGHLPVSVSPA